MNRTLEAVLRISSKLGDMRAFGETSKKLADIDRKASAYNRRMGAVGRTTQWAGGMVSRYGAMAAAAGTAAAVASVKGYATLERQLTRIGINADASREQMASAMDSMRRMAQDTATPIDDVVEGLESLIASGKSLPEAMALLPSVVRTAQSAAAPLGEMATTADAIGNSFHIAAGDMERAFDIIAKGGKAGKFELKDMAAELPSLAPAFAALGYQGEDGLKRLTAALQTVRMETGQSGEAATAFMDVISKMNSTTIANNFKKNFGVDIRKEMEKSKQLGEDTLEAFIRLSREAIDGDMSKLPLLFTDKQMLIGMRALMNHTEEFRVLLGQLGDSAGTVRNDLKRVTDDAQAGFDKLSNSADRLFKSFGRGVNSMGVPEMLSGIASNIDYAAAVNAGLETSGQASGFWERSVWGVTHSETDKINMARRGGWRPEGEAAAMAPYTEYGASRLNVLGPRTGQVPIPSRRPGAAPFALGPQEAAWPQYPTSAPIMGGGPSAGQTVPELTDLVAKLEQAGSGAGDELSRGGSDAGQAVAAGGQEAGAALRDGAAAFRATMGELSALTQSLGATAREMRSSAVSVRADVGYAPSATQRPR